MKMMAVCASKYHAWHLENVEGRLQRVRIHSEYCGLLIWTGGRNAWGVGYDGMECPPLSYRTLTDARFQAAWVAAQGDQ